MTPGASPSGPAPITDLSRFAIHTVTTRPWPIETAIDEYARAGFGGISIWRDAMDGRDPGAIRRRIGEAGLAGVSLVRGGFFAHADESARRAALEDNRRCIDEAHALGLPLIVLVCGADPAVGVNDSRRMITDALIELAPEAAAAGVRLGIEPLHPMYADTRSAINTLTQSNRIAGEVNAAVRTWSDAGTHPGGRRAPDAQPHAPGDARPPSRGEASSPASGVRPVAPGDARPPSRGEASSPASDARPVAPGDARPTVCSVVDVYHLWWDETLPEAIAEAGRQGLLAAFHVCDWRVPTEHMLLDRGLMGEGAIDIPGIRRDVETAGFTGPIEVEIFSERYWAMDQGEWLGRIANACRTAV
ncbi:MAG: TIM barrel protein [Alkalispirochaeta sp.]